MAKNMKKAAKPNLSKEVIKGLKADVKAFKAEIKAMKAAHKQELAEKVQLAYDSAVEAAIMELETIEMQRHNFVEKAIDKALVEFDKKVMKKGKKKVAKKKPAKKAAVAKKAPATKAVVAKKAPAKKKAVAKKKTAKKA